MAAFDYFKELNTGAPAFVNNNPQPGVAGPVNNMRIYAYSGNTWPHEDPQPVPARADVIGASNLNSLSWPTGCWWQGSTVASRNKRIWWWPATANVPNGCKPATRFVKLSARRRPRRRRPPTDGELCDHLYAAGTGVALAKLDGQYPSPNILSCRAHCNTETRGYACRDACSTYLYGNVGIGLRQINNGITYAARSLTDCEAFCNAWWASCDNENECTKIARSARASAAGPTLGAGCRT